MIFNTGGYGHAGLLRRRLTAVILLGSPHSFVDESFIVASAFLVFIFAGSNRHLACQQSGHRIPSFRFGSDSSNVSFGSASDLPVNSRFACSQFRFCNVVR
jgi:hypothetical protein